MSEARLPKNVATEAAGLRDMGGWLQVEKQTLRAITALSIKHPVAAGMLHLLASKMNRTNAVVISKRAIADELGVTERSVERAVVVLKDGKWVQVAKAGTQNVYIMNSRVYWQGARGARFANFYAAVTLTEKDQAAGEVDDKSELRQIPVAGDGERYLVGNEQLPPPDQQEMELP
ncbi:replication/maintenance protein RepL [Paraburkholderia sp. J8-2]|uniref:replication/maintenance protein RepL n=1 Tax=Paraburkholderia sp. J8-2 TaxID=2805440 RepID=UPI002AB7BE7E|nr:replication/maintenance protein RepL [Paraburkholderia sp. J8-2]